jgi:lipopolysaccharide transport system ATP-binding protein
MSDVVISVENISKSYQLGVIDTGTFRGDLQRWWAKQRGLPDPFLKVGQKDHGNREGETVWALKNVDFQVKHGEAIGIIGRNGAGKSTLLKILSRVTAPTSGEIKVKGLIASLLEVGTGFHPELTGRENIFLNGAILGMTRHEIARKFDEIVDFSGVETYIDTPVKRYSSGMYVRLAFAVAAHLDPDILIVDEVLAVGDAEFQKKCLGKMDTASRGGKTVLFVSHNMTAIKSLCQSSILLNKGQIEKIGKTEEVVDRYLSVNYKDIHERNWNDPKDAPGNETVRLLHASIERTDGLKTDWDVSTPLRLRFRILNQLDGGRLYFNFLLYTNERICVFNLASQQMPWTTGLVEATCDIPANLLNDKNYTVDLAVHYQGTEGLYLPEVLAFELRDNVERSGGWYGEWTGVVRPSLEWNLQKINHKGSLLE